MANSCYFLRDRIRVDIPLRGARTHTDTMVLLGAGLAFLCFCLIISCAICWRKRKNSSCNNDKEQTPERIILEPSPTLPGQTSAPVKQQYEEVEGEVLDYPTYDADDLPVFEPESEFKRSLHSRPSLPSLHGRASLTTVPVVQKQSLAAKTKRMLERRCTVSGDGSLYNEHTKLRRASARLTSSILGHSQTMPDDLAGIKSKPRPALHFTLFYSAYEVTLTVAVISVANLPKRFGSGCDSYVKVYLLPRFLEPQQTAVHRKSLNPEYRECFQFSGYTLDEVKGFTLRFATYVKEFHSFKDTFVGEVLFPCEQGDWKPDVPSTYIKELTATKTKLKKVRGWKMPSLLNIAHLTHPIKVMIRKAENLGRMTRILGSPDHYVIIHLYQDGKIMATKETKTANSCNPVWNAPFLFDIPPGDIESRQLSLEFIVMQSRIYTRNCVLGRLSIGGNAGEMGRMHWKEMCSRGHVESARWHPIYPDTL
uniref:C2 domain-containing protein n=1 Tax=Callorhinchus milii TaxID=7868 RepID=A0A4W3IIA6_CALMI